MPPVAGLAEAQSSGIANSSFQTSVNVTGLQNTWLPLPYPYTALSGLDGSWLYSQKTGVVFTHNGDSYQRTYTVTNVDVNPSVAQLRAASSSDDPTLAQYTALPAGIPAMVRQTALAITAGKTTDYDKAMALQNFFLDPANGFTYSLDVPTSTLNPIQAFLTNKTGFCQQFAGTFAVLAREAGLPTRVDVGFTQGSKAGATDSYTVTLRNAHAWPEVYFSGIGWVRFEPTPGGVNTVGISGPSYAPQPTAVAPVGGNTHQTEHDGTAASKLADKDARDSGGATGNPEQAGAAAVAQASFPWRRVGAGVVLLAALVAPCLGGLVRRRRRLSPRRALHVARPAR